MTVENFALCRVRSSLALVAVIILLCDFANSWRAAVRIKMYHSDRSVDRSVRIVRQLEQVVELSRLLFRELKEAKNRLCFVMFLRREVKH